MKVPIQCGNPECSLRGKVINEVTINKKGVDAFINAFGHGSEDPPDYCPKCGKLGILQEPVEA